MHVAKAGVCPERAWPSAVLIERRKKYVFARPFVTVKNSLTPLRFNVKLPLMRGLLNGDS